jgi:hypothetical protein
VLVNDDAKKKVLARRAKFIAAAVAGIAVACGKQKVEDHPEAGPCLSTFVIPDGGVDVRAIPHACLSPPARRVDAGPCNCQPGDPLCSCL